MLESWKTSDALGQWKLQTKLRCQSAQTKGFTSNSTWQKMPIQSPGSCLAHCWWGMLFRNPSNRCILCMLPDISVPSSNVKATHIYQSFMIICPLERIAWTTLSGESDIDGMRFQIQTEQMISKGLWYKEYLKGAYVLCQNILLDVNSQSPELKWNC